MARRSGEVSLTEAAGMLECHRDTVYKWAKEARSGGDGPLEYARQDFTGRWWLDKQEIRALIEDAKNRDYV